MKLEDKFFNTFFYPFLISVISSTLIVILFVGIFTNTHLDKKTNSNMINLGYKFSKININSANLLVTTVLLKIQASLNEQILFYQKMSKKMLDTNISELTLHNEYFKCIFDYNDSYINSELKNLQYMAFWHSTRNITNYNDIKDNITKKQLISFSNMMQNLYSTLAAFPKDNSVYVYFFIFDQTDLFIAYPISYYKEYGYLNVYKDYKGNAFWCINEEGKVFDVYNAKCRNFYLNIQKAKSDKYDNNYSSKRNRTIFVTNFYKQLDYENSPNVYTMCIQFIDPISNDNAYACSDISQEDLKSAFDNFNSNLKGYYFISGVGFNYVYFFPHTYIPKTITENIFRWDFDYLMEEKAFFYNNIQKILTSNYIDQIRNTLYEEVFVKGKNSSDQYFFLNNVKYKYSIFPIILENLYGQKEHVLSIIYIYNNDLFLSELISEEYSLATKLVLELILFIILSWGLLHIIILTFKILAKYIVIPIKNVNYMLKGINIGGENRLDFINYLKKKQDNNLEKLEKIYLLEDKYKDNNNLNENNSLVENDDINSEIQKENNNDELILRNKDYNKKYDEESSYIEKELNFYDFNDEFLQYRPLEIELLVKSLINLKGALILTSSDQPVEQIIKYSFTENIFKNLKNKEGTSICQSNIGSLQIQLLKFDKAIYHLALSLQDNELKKFLERTLSDELDESDCLLNQISDSFNKLKSKTKNNILMKKQQNNKKENFSQKTVGIFINIRYERLIYAYYKFFKGMKKLKKMNNDRINGQFMNTYFHNINYYHKIIIQYIYLSYLKNDLIKIGESILDYLEFLITFKFKTSEDKSYIFNIKYKDNTKYREKQKIKKDAFYKIINWFNLFDDYISYVKDNTTLGNEKTISNDFSNPEDKKLNSGNQSIFLFKVNIQRSDFLRGKLALCCKNYNDALYYFIKSSQKKSIVIDGLIKKKSLKHLYKIIHKMKINYEKYGLGKLPLKENFNEFEKVKAKLKRKKLNNKNIENNIDNLQKTFNDEIQIIKNGIINDISECNAKKEKDIIIIIDFNIYKKKDNNQVNIDKIEAFLIQTKTILHNYLSSNDRCAIFIYTKRYKIICPLIYKYQIDLQNFYDDLIHYKNTTLSKDIDKDEYLEDINSNNFEFELGGKIFSENSQEEESSGNYIKIKYNVIEGLIDTINYTNNYLKMKEEITNERYIILFTDLFNNDNFDDEEMKEIFNKLKSNKETMLLLVGKNKNFKKDDDSITSNGDKFITKYIISKFEDKSEIIYFENMKKIGTILSHNNVIKDEIIYPNEIYK